MNITKAMESPNTGKSPTMGNSFCRRRSESLAVSDFPSPPGIPAQRLKDAADFRKWGKEMVDYIADYLGHLSERRVTPSVQPGYLRDLIPLEAPRQGEDWATILQDLERVIMPGVTHWQHPQFHAYFTAGSSYTSLMGDMLSDAMNSIGFSWAASPANTELEIIVLDWLGKMIGLPEEFLNLSAKGQGGGVIQGSASECVLVSLLAARHSTLSQDHKQQQQPRIEEATLLSKLVAYTSKESHSSVEKAAMVGFVKLRMLETDQRFSLRGQTLANAIKEDREKGLIPFFVVATLGTTSCCSFDALEELGEVCREENLWLHVDASYAGSACICPEFKYLLRGVQYASSFNMSPHKWMLVNHDCSTLWVKDRIKVTQALNVDPLYLQHSNSESTIDYRHWGIPLSRRFRALKIWFVLRKYGVEGLQSYIREHVRLAKRFERLVRSDPRFEVINEVRLGLICFRLKGCNEPSERLLAGINASGKIHMVPSCLKGRYVIRFCVCAEHSTEEDVQYGWDVITRFTDDQMLPGRKATVLNGTRANGLNGQTEMKTGNETSWLKIGAQLNGQHEIQIGNLTIAENGMQINGRRDVETEKGLKGYKTGCFNGINYLSDQNGIEMKGHKGYQTDDQNGIGTNGHNGNETVDQNGILTNGHNGYPTNGYTEIEDKNTQNAVGMEGQDLHPFSGLTGFKIDSSKDRYKGGVPFQVSSSQCAFSLNGN